VNWLVNGTVEGFIKVTTTQHLWVIRKVISYRAWWNSHGKFHAQISCTCHISPQTLQANLAFCSENDGFLTTFPFIRIVFKNVTLRRFATLMPIISCTIMYYVCVTIQPGLKKLKYRGNIHVYWKFNWKNCLRFYIISCRSRHQYHNIDIIWRCNRSC